MRDSDKQMLADHYLDFYRMAYSLLHNPTDVEDVVQEALVETMSQPWVNNPYNYCARVVHNNCYKLLKRNYILTDKLPDKPYYDDPLDEQQLQTLWQYKEQLPSRIRDIFNLHYEKGYSRQKIAELTGITPSALKKLFYKGHKILLKQLIDHEKSKTFKF